MAPTDPAGAAPAAGPGPTGVGPGGIDPARVAFVWQPRTGLERALLGAVSAKDLDSYVGLLLDAELVLPTPPALAPRTLWLTVPLDGGPAVIVQTAHPDSRNAWRAPDGSPQRGVPVTGRQLAAAWPDPTWALLVAPGLPIEAIIEPADLIGAANPPLTDPDTVVQQAVPARRVAELLDDDAPQDDPVDRVSGYVQALTEVAHLTTPAAMISALGLNRPDSGFDPLDDAIHLLRWPIGEPRLYLPAVGGATAEAAGALGGRIVDERPFLGTGFAPDPVALVREFRVTGAVLPHRAELHRLGLDGEEELIGLFSADAGRWFPLSAEMFAEAERSRAAAVEMLGDQVAKAAEQEAEQERRAGGSES